MKSIIIYIIFALSILFNVVSAKRHYKKHCHKRYHHKKRHHQKHHHQIISVQKDPPGLFSWFYGKHSGIGSWFATKDGKGTNGHAWCGYEYIDTSNGFAVSLAHLLEMTGDRSKWEYYGKKYCGLEALVTNPNNGKSKLMYIIDAFDDHWVLTPYSIDIAKGVFPDLYGEATDDKNIVIQNVQWQLTGKRSEKYSFKGPGDSWDK